MKYRRGDDCDCYELDGVAVMRGDELELLDGEAWVRVVVDGYEGPIVDVVLLETGEVRALTSDDLLRWPS